jgi:Family of unknown function (DUF6158)
MSDNEVRGVPATELSDEELEQQGKQAHDTRNWVFLHGSAEQFARHTTRMLELEREYLRRYPKRTWQGSGGAAADTAGTAEAWRETVRGVIRQLEALVAQPDASTPATADTPADPAEAFLHRIAGAGGRLHKLEAHQVAREVGLERSLLADLYKADPPLLSTEGEDRVLTEQGRAHLQESAG